MASWSPPWLDDEPPQDRLYVVDPIDTWEEELQPWERRWYEDHAYEPEREW